MTNKKQKWQVLGFYEYAGTVRCVQARIKKNGKAVFSVSRVSSYNNCYGVLPRLDATEQWYKITGTDK